MSIVTEAVAQMEKVTHGTGCQDCNVKIERQPDAPSCQYVRGVNLRIGFGGTASDVVTRYPVETVTRIPFMFGASLESPEQRTAACGIMSVVARFLCLCRKAQACAHEDHARCFENFHSVYEGEKIFVNGDMPDLVRLLGKSVVSSPEEADVIVVGGDGLFSADSLAVTDEYRGKKQMVFIGPSTAGVAAFLNEEHWCPFAR
ncbi:hypothetical protein [Methanogenium organophilum]|uniref:Uncharacterized protein n=1 Tax=Methanogenium organophilum TaxID=2199 RepID=A0A9X9S3M9_METOG|nr:hypothetical protein [Methanogenium organophilum]WAI00305.1 hypothetical protein OU421_07640 [Methanogenium organophilum]